MITRTGFREVARRIVVLAVLTAGLVLLFKQPVWIGLLVLLAGLVIYILMPWPKPPAGAHVYARGPAVVGPDIMGFMLTGIFLALPFIIGIAGTMLLFLPVALISGLILYIAAWYGSFYLVIRDDGLVVHTLGRCRELAFSDIRGAVPYKRGLPDWVRKLVPFLVLSGAYGAAGSIMLARDETGMELQLANGKRQRIPRQGFEKSFKQLALALEAAGIDILQRWKKSG